MLPTTPAPRPPGQPLRGRFFELSPIDPARDTLPLFEATHGSPEKEATWTWLHDGPFPSADAMRAWMEGMAAEAAAVSYTAFERASGRPVGGCQYLNIVPAMRRVEIGRIWYEPTHRRTKANTEVAYLLLREAFELGYRRVEWKCDAGNEASRRAALRLGFSPEGLFRQHMIVKNRNRDTVWFSLLDGEWPAARARLEHWLYEAPTDATGRPLTALARVAG